MMAMMATMTMMTTMMMMMTTTTLMLMMRKPVLVYVPQFSGWLTRAGGRDGRVMVITNNIERKKKRDKNRVFSLGLPLKCLSTEKLI